MLWAVLSRIDSSGPIRLHTALPSIAGRPDVFFRLPIVPRSIPTEEEFRNGCGPFGAVLRVPGSCWSDYRGSGNPGAAVGGVR